MRSTSSSGSPATPAPAPTSSPAAPSPKLNLGLALLADPDLLLLDEPYAGFDWDTYQKFWGIVADRRTAGRTVLIVSHFLVDQERFDRIIEVEEGLAVPR